MRDYRLWRVGLMWMIIVGVGHSMAWAGVPQPANPIDIQHWITACGQASDYPGAAVVNVLDESDVYVQHSGLATTDSCQVVKILTDEGVRSQSVQRLNYDPSTNRENFKSIRIYRTSGKIEDVPLDQIVTQPAPQSMIYWGRDQQLVSLPRLEIGDAIEIRTCRTGYNIAYLDGPVAQDTTNQKGDALDPPMPGHWYEVTLFQSSVPIYRKRYSVHLPKDMPVQYEVYNQPIKTSMWFDKDRDVYTWEAERIPAVKGESHMIALDDCVPKVVLATVPDWETKSRWFWEANKKQFDSTDAVLTQARKITAGLTTDEQKIAACLHWVADNIRYCGTSRGQHEGFILHRGDEVLQDRFGVCKDKAGMLVTLLRALGYEAYPSLTMAGSRVEAIPADQFNHTVTVLRNSDGSFRVLDPTWSPLSRELWSTREPLQGLVYGTPEGQSLTLSPYFPPADNSLSARSTTHLDANGSMTTEMAFDLKGYPCTYFRRNIEKNSKPYQRSSVEQALSIAPNAILGDVNFTDPYDYSQGTHVELAAQANNYVVTGDHLRAFRLPLLSHPLSSFWIPDFFYPLPEKERKYALVMRATRLICYEEAIEIPDDWQVKSLPPAVSLDTPSISLTFAAKQENNRIMFKTELVLKKQIVPSEDYASFKNVLESLKRLSEAWVVCEVRS